MCLDVIHNEKDQKEIVKNLKTRKDDYVIVYKVFCVDYDDNLIAQFEDYDFYEGKNTSKSKYITNFLGIKDLWTQDKN